MASSSTQIKFGQIPQTITKPLHTSSLGGSSTTKPEDFLALIQQQLKLSDVFVPEQRLHATFSLPSTQEALPTGKINTGHIPEKPFSSPVISPIGADDIPKTHVQTPTATKTQLSPSAWNQEKELPVTKQEAQTSPGPFKHPDQHNPAFSYSHPTDQLVARMGVDVKDFSHHGYFEKKSSGSVFARKTLLPVGYVAGPLSIGALATTIGVTQAGVGGAITTGVAGLSTGAAIGTGAGAAAVGAMLAGYVAWAGNRTSRVMKGYKNEINKIKQELMQPGNENAVRWYLRTVQAGSAKRKAKKMNAITEAQLNDIQNPGLIQHKVYKVYVRHAQNQNKVFLTRNPDTARKLIAENTRLAEEHKANK